MCDGTEAGSEGDSAAGHCLEDLEALGLEISTGKWILSEMAVCHSYRTEFDESRLDCRANQHRIVAKLTLH